MIACFNPPSGTCPSNPSFHESRLGHCQKAEQMSDDGRVVYTEDGIAACRHPIARVARSCLQFGATQLPLSGPLAYVFSCYDQFPRAFQNFFHFIIGFSRAAVQFRATVWQSIFTHDMRRYQRTLFSRMADFTSLIMGPSGTGKELVAQAIGLSRYVPFNPKTRSFADGLKDAYFPLNLSALSPTLIESELFGHKRGSFTGAEADRVG